jgi:hypothetical protein
MVLNLPLDECIDNTHDLLPKRKRKEKKLIKEKLQQVIESQIKAKSKITGKRTSLGPLRQGQRLDTSETKHAQAKSANHQTKTQTPQRAPLHICKLPLSQSTLPLNQCSNATRECSKEQKTAHSAQGG